jgi:hypothetical protein
MDGRRDRIPFLYPRNSNRQCACICVTGSGLSGRSRHRIARLCVVANKAIGGTQAIAADNHGTSGAAPGMSAWTALPLTLTTAAAHSTAQKNRLLPRWCR